MQANISPLSISISSLYRHVTPDKFHIEACDDGANDVLVIDRASMEMTLTGKTRGTQINRKRREGTEESKKDLADLFVYTEYGETKKKKKKEVCRCVFVIKRSNLVVIFIYLFIWDALSVYVKYN